ncbi:MAG: peptidoglycan editing factor PgeF [Clostridia bacterium]|nr:peptidoglycan editing factor PgeF [Clostridia bacterium]
MAGFEMIKEDGLTYFLVSGWYEEGALAVFSTRRGGLSGGSYATLNLSFRVGDEAATVRENRRRLARALGIPVERWVAGAQVHGSRVAEVGEAEAGQGAMRAEDAIAAADGLVTRLPRLALVGLFADCVPLLFFRRFPPAVAVIHAGWRGTVAGIAQAAVDALCCEPGAGPADLKVAIGPSIGPCCYIVGEEVVAGLRALLGPEVETVVFPEGQRWRADLAQANVLALRRRGVAAEQISLFSRCTACHPEWFYSHRRDGGRSGRFAALVSLF